MRLNIKILLNEQNMQNETQTLFIHAKPFIVNKKPQLIKRVTGHS